MDEVFKALADESRRTLLDRLNAHNGQSLRELCAGLAMTRQSVSKHLSVLEAAGLVTTVWQGREKLHYLDAAPINAIADRWMTRYDRARAHALADLKTALETTTMPDNAFAYTTYINTTPERLWQALTDSSFTEQYWGMRFDTDWQVGSTMTWHYAGATVQDPEQKVLEYEPYRRLSYTWQSFPPNFTDAVGFDADFADRLRADKQRSKVSFDIEPTDDGVKLTVLHDGFDSPDSIVLESISGGWPMVLSALKSLLEASDSPAAASSTG